ncbi:MAG TPA: peptidylprolyl isomerase [Dehalococcoidia bacterium]|nr:peptidylprolyl isomerase [Dehalococcoidia bacterium]
MEASLKSYPQEPPLTIDPARRYFAVIRTSAGNIRLQLLPAEAPRAVNSFVFLAREGFYNGLTFYRVLPDFIAQAGDPSCDAQDRFACRGSGGPGYILPLEPGGPPHASGTVAMAAIASSANVSGSQFYIAQADLPGQAGKDTVFARVVEGMQVVESLSLRNPCFGPATAQSDCEPDPPPGTEILSVTIEEL